MLRFARIWQAADKTVYAEHASGEGIPPEGGWRVEASIVSRYFGGWPHPRRPRDSDPARGRAPFFQWNGLASLTRAGLIEAFFAGSGP